MRQVQERETEEYDEAADRVARVPPVKKSVKLVSVPENIPDPAPTPGQNVMDMFAELKSLIRPLAPPKDQQIRNVRQVPTNLACFNCKQEGHMARQCPQKQREMTCFVCQQKGHRAYLCPQKRCMRCGHVGHDVRTCTMTPVVSGM